MRAVNLVPKDYRRGALAGKGGETFSYLTLGGLAVVLLAVVAVVLTNNSIADKKSQIATLKQDEIDAKAKADALDPYAQFASLQQARTSTVSSLAQSRFDWERTLRELAVIIPADIQMKSLRGTVTPDVSLSNSPTVQLRTNVPGPALELVGCAPGQDQVATFAAAIEDVDGVTRVGVQSSGTGDQPTTQEAASSESPDTCKQGLSHFEIVAAFDAAPVPPTSADGTPSVLPAPSAPAPSAPEGNGSNPAQEQQASQQQSVQSTKEKVGKATKIIPGN
jgi:Tfp pilus assembly protein PilN